MKLKKLLFILLGTLIAPAVAVFSLGVWRLLTTSSVSTDFSDLIGFGSFLYVFAFAFTVVLALPAFTVVY